MSDELLLSGVPILFASEMKDRLGMSSADLLFPENLERFKTIAQYAYKTGEPSLFLARIGAIHRAKNTTEKLRYIEEYISVSERRKALSKELEDASEEMSQYER